MLPVSGEPYVLPQTSLQFRGGVPGAAGSSEPDEEVPGWDACWGGTAAGPGCKRDGGDGRPRGVGMPVCLE